MHRSNPVAEKMRRAVESERFERAASQAVAIEAASTALRDELSRPSPAFRHLSPARVWNGYLPGLSNAPHNVKRRKQKLVA